MNLLTRQIYGLKKGVTGFNTYIGGVSPTISTAALLATKLGISVGNISNFTIVGADIKCLITGSYSIPSAAFSGESSLTYYYDSGKLITSIGNTGFQNTGSLLWIYIPNCTVLGSSASVDNSCFQNSPANSIFYLSPTLATSNSGAEEADVAGIRARNGDIRYVTNFTAPAPVTTLSSGTIFNSSVALNFTTPSSTNAIDYYECYADDVFKNRGKTITGLTNNTNYNVTIYAIDVFFNKSLVSNNLNVTTSNRSATDSDAIAYITASGNSAYQDIIDDIYTSLKSNSLYTKIQAFYPFLGTTAAQHKYNAKNPLDTDAAFRLMFTGAATFSNNGYQLNGSSYANTYFIPNTNQTLNNHGVTVVTGTNNASLNPAVEIGSFVNPNGVMLASKRFTGGRKDFHSGTTIAAETGINESRCILTGCRTGSNVTKMYKNGGLIATGTGSGTLSTIPYDIGRLSPANGQYSNQRIQFTAIHEGLSDADSIALHGIIDTFENALGRKTW